METVAVFGSTSGIAQAVVEEFLRRGRKVILCARDPAALERQAGDLKARFGFDVPVFVWDALDFSGHSDSIRKLTGQYEISGIFIAAGIMPSQEECEKDWETARLLMDTNLTGPVLLINAFIPYFSARNGGFISCISSVAGDRGRRSNFIYGASKGGLSVYLEGLRSSLASGRVLVQDVRCGPVRTAMTAQMDKLPLAVLPEQAARVIVKGIERKKELLYVPFFWRYIMAVIKMIPIKIFKKINL